MNFPEAVMVVTVPFFCTIGGWFVGLMSGIVAGFFLCRSAVGKLPEPRRRRVYAHHPRRWVQREPRTWPVALLAEPQSLQVVE